MKYIERLRKEAEELTQARMIHLRSGDLVRAERTQLRLDEVEAKIKEAEVYEPRALALQLTKEEIEKSGIIDMIIKTHIAADFYCDVCTDFKNLMKKLGFADCSLYRRIDQLRKLSAEYAALVCHPEFGKLSDFMVNNETLLAALHKKIDSSIENKLKKNK